MPSERTVWEIHDLDTTLQQAGVDLNRVHYETGIHIVHLEQILADHGNRYFRHRTISKIERYFLENHGLRVNKSKKR